MQFHWFAKSSGKGHVVSPLRRLRYCVLLAMLVAAATVRAADPPASAPASQPVRSREEINALIDKAGKEPPAWWSDVKLSTPATLDLTWPTIVGPWDPNKNISQYYESVINPNPARHREGCKLMHQILAKNKGDTPVEVRALRMLGRIYGVYLRDWARGAFWYRKAAEFTPLNGDDTAELAYYYWKLGNREMGLAEIDDRGRNTIRTIRVLGDMAEIDKALAIARQLAARSPEDAYLAGGDVCRATGRYKEAIGWYQQVMALKPADPAKPERINRYQARASAGIDAAKLFDQIKLNSTPDGTYASESPGYRGPIKVEVVVKGGTIAAVNIAGSTDDWPLNAQVVVPAEIIEKQSIQVDTVSGATFTSEAIINAAGKALGGAKK